MYQLVIVDDEDKIVEGIAKSVSMGTVRISGNVVQQAFKGIGIRKNPSGPCTYE